MNLSFVNIETDPGCFCVAEIHQDQGCILRLYRNSFVFSDDANIGLFFGFPNVDFQGNMNNLVHMILEAAKQLKAVKLIGPVEGNTWNDYRLSDHEEELFTGDIAGNFAFETALKLAGFQEKYHYVSTELTDKNIQVPFITNRDFFENETECIYPGPDELEAFLPQLYLSANDIFSGNLFFSPISETHFYQKFGSLKYLIEKGDVILVQHKQKLIAFGLAYRDRKPQGISTFVLKTIGRIPDKIYSGVGAWVSEYMYKRFAAGNYEKFVQALMFADNISLKIARHYRAEIMKNYTLYEKNI